MRKFRKILLAALLPALASLTSAAQSSLRTEEVAQRLVEEGFANVRAAESEDYTVFALENDLYKIPGEGFARATEIIREAGLGLNKPVKLIGLNFNVPEVTITYDPAVDRWRTTRRLDASWDLVRKQPRMKTTKLEDITKVARYTSRDGSTGFKIEAKGKTFTLHS